MDPADALIFAVAALADLVFLVTLWSYRARKAARGRITAGLRLAFHTGRLAPCGSGYNRVRARRQVPGGAGPNVLLARSA
jgi:hypothetical protein